METKNSDVNFVEFAIGNLLDYFYANGAKLFRVISKENSEKALSFFRKTFPDEVFTSIYCHHNYAGNYEFTIISFYFQSENSISPKYVVLTWSVYLHFFRRIYPHRFFVIEKVNNSSKSMYVISEFDRKRNLLLNGPIRGKHSNFVEPVQSIIELDEIKRYSSFSLSKENPKISEWRLKHPTSTSPSTIKFSFDVLYYRADNNPKIKYIIDDWKGKIPNKCFAEGIRIVYPFYYEYRKIIKQLQEKEYISPEMFDFYKEYLVKAWNFLVQRYITVGAQIGRSEVNKGISDKELSKDILEYKDSLELIQEPLIRIMERIDYDEKECFSEEEISFNWPPLNVIQDEIIEIGVRYSRNIQYKDDLNSFDYKYPFQYTLIDNGDLLDIANRNADPNVRKMARNVYIDRFPGGPKAFEENMIKLIEGLRNPKDRDLLSLLIMSKGEFILPYLRIYLEAKELEFRPTIERIVKKIEEYIPK